MKSLVQERAETIVTTLYNSANPATSKDVAKWLNITEASAVVVLNQLLKVKLLAKEGKARYTKYTLGENVASLIRKRMGDNGDLFTSIKSCVNDALKVPEKPNDSEFIHTSDGKVLRKVHQTNVKPLSEHNQQAVNYLLDILAQNESIKTLQERIKSLEQQVEELTYENKRMKETLKSIKGLC